MSTLGGSYFGRLAAGASACLMAAGVLAGCGGSTAKTAATPKAQLQSSFDSLYSSPTLSVNFHLDATPAQLHAVAPSIPTPFDSVITGASVVIKEATANGQPLYSLGRTARAAGTPAALVNLLSQVDLDMAFLAGGTELLDFRLLGGVVYARADIADSLALVGATPAVLAGARAKIPSGAQYNFARAALDGNWVSFNAIQALQGLLSTAPVVPQSQLKAEEAKFAGALESVFNKDVTVANAGSAGAASKLAVSANLRNVLGDLASAFMQLAPSSRSVGGMVAPDLSKVPDKTVTADALVNGSTLSGLQINISQFLPAVSPSAKPLVVGATVSHPPVDIVTPKGATAATLPGLEGLFGRLGGTASKSAALTPPAKA